MSQTDENGIYLLHIAVLSGYENTVALLIDKGANINYQDKYRQTPLRITATEGHENIATFLIEKGRTQVNIRDNH